MNTAPDTTAQPTSGPEITIRRTFDAPRPLVFAAWTEDEHTRRWFVPKGCKLLDTGGDLRVGGAWRMAMIVPSGEEFRASGEYREIVPNEKLVFTHAWEGDDGLPEHWTTVTVRFEDAPGGKTLLTFHQAFFRSVKSRDSHAHGWGETLDSLEGYLPEVCRTKGVA